MVDPDQQRPVEKADRERLGGRFLWSFVAAMGALALWLTYSTISNLSHTRSSPPKPKLREFVHPTVAATMHAPPGASAFDGGASPRQFVAVPSTNDTPAAAPPAPPAPAVKPPPNPRGPAVWFGPRVSNSRADRGYSQASVEDWRQKGRVGPAPSQVRVWSPALGAGAVGADSTVPRETWRFKAARDTALAQGSAAPGAFGQRHPFVEAFDAEGNVHRLLLDNNDHLFYRAPSGQQLAIDTLHRVTAFNLRVDLARQVHVIWYEADAGELSYCWLVPAGEGAARHFCDFIGKSPEPEYIRIVPMPSFIKVEVGNEADAYRRTIKIDTHDPKVRVTGG